ncbi:MAG: YCF48-related protein [Motiliproteus sp.]
MRYRLRHWAGAAVFPGNGAAAAVGRLLALMLLAYCCAVTQVSAADRLDTPSRASALAVNSLLLDITIVGTRLIAVGERGHILTSDDAGVNWQQAQVPVSSTLTAVQFATEKLGWAVGHDGVILHTQDGGLSWQKQLDGYQLNRLVVDYYQQSIDRRDSAGEQQESATDDSELTESVDLEMALDDAQFSLDEGPNRPLLDLHFSDQKHGWVLGAYGVLLQTFDGGATWQPAMLQLDNPDSFHLNVITPQNNHLMIAGEAGLAFRSDDQGSTWHRLQTGYDGPFFSAIALPTQGQFLLTGLRGRLFLTPDAGTNWQAIETPTRSTFTGGQALVAGTVVGVGNGGALYYADSVDSADPENDAILIRIHPDRQSYTALVEATPGQLVLVGQKGVSHLSVDRLKEGAL